MPRTNDYSLQPSLSFQTQVQTSESTATAEETATTEEATRAKRQGRANFLQAVTLCCIIMAAIFFLITFAGGGGMAYFFAWPLLTIGLLAIAGVISYVVEDPNNTFFIVPVWFLLALVDSSTLTMWISTGWTGVNLLVKSFIAFFGVMAGIAETIYVL